MRIGVCPIPLYLPAETFSVPTVNVAIQSVSSLHFETLDGLLGGPNIPFCSRKHLRSTFQRIMLETINVPARCVEILANVFPPTVWWTSCRDAATGA